jgi:hypothetical protein
MNTTENEILAAITAAISAIGTSQGYKLIVKNFKRVGQTSPVWNTTGRVDYIRQKLNS